MSKKRQDYDKALLELWRPPRRAREPLGCLTTTYTFDPGFFEEECLARFLEMDSLADREGLAYKLERESRLGPVYAGVLVDREQAGVDHSLRWDVLPVLIPHAKQHAKLTLLAWRDYVRLIVASANLTKSGYRSNQEVAGTMEFSPEAASREQMSACCDFLQALIAFVPSAAKEDKACGRALDFIARVRAQVHSWSESRKRVNQMTTHLVVTLPAPPGNPEQQSSTLESFLTLCRRNGKAPPEVQVCSPFFDPSPAEAEDRVTAALCKGMGRGTRRRLTFCVPAVAEEEAESVRLAAPESICRTAENRVDDLRIHILPSRDPDRNVRQWHAKMVGLKSSKYDALLVGSSNFTKAGMGVGPIRNTEANLLYVARTQGNGREARALNQCWPNTTPLKNPDKAEWVGPQNALDEEENESKALPLPAGFVSAHYRAGNSPAILLTLDPEKLPVEWRVLGGTKHDELLLDSADWLYRQKPSQAEVPWNHGYAPGKLLVNWEGNQRFLAVNVEDEDDLPLPEEIEGMSSHDLLFFLAATDPGAALRAWAHGHSEKQGFDEELDSAVPPDLDPLRRYDLQETFLRRVRRQARQLSALREKLERPVWSEHALKWNLTGIIGVQRYACRLMSEMDGNSGNPAENVLSLADLMLTLSETEYQGADGALTRQQFDKVFKPFLKELADDVDRKIRSKGSRISRDVTQFWKRVYERCRS